MPVTIAPFIVELEHHDFDPRWNRVNGVTVSDGALHIDPKEHFFKATTSGWRVIDWEMVVTEMFPATETEDIALEQKALDFIKANVRTTHDPTEVLGIAWQVYSYLFREEHLPSLGVEGITAEHLKMLAEVSTLTALNKVEQDGTISVVGPSWFFADVAQVVYDLDEPTVEKLDEVFHGGLFNETRRIESIKAHTALGGRLVHGCQSAPDRRGGVVAPYATSMDTFREQLNEFRDEWIASVRKLSDAA